MPTRSHGPEGRATNRPRIGSRTAMTREERDTRGPHDDLNTSQADSPGPCPGPCPNHRGEPRCPARSGRPRRDAPRPRRAGPPRGPGDRCGLRRDRTRQQAADALRELAELHPQIVQLQRCVDGESQRAWPRTSRPSAARSRSGCAEPSAAMNCRLRKARPCRAGAIETLLTLPTKAGGFSVRRRSRSCPARPARGRRRTAPPGSRRRCR